MNYPLNWAYAHGGPTLQAQFKRECEDFIVTEHLGFEPEGSGEHVFLWVEKTGSNTTWVADELARHAGVPQVAVGYSGLKDRQAVTRQWFSVAVHPSQEPDWQRLNSDNLRILSVSRHLRKLKRGVHKSNHFEIRLRQLQGDRDKLFAQLTSIKTSGFPNYFGDQRFGRQGNNLPAAERMFAGARVKRQQRSHYLSAARSWLFNQLLSQQVAHSTWLAAKPEGHYFLSGSASHFAAEGEDNLQSRIDALDIHPAAELWGRTKSILTTHCVALIEQYPTLCKGIESAGLNMEYRAVREVPVDFSWREEGDDLVLIFSLGRGSYATALLRECFEWSNNSAD
jgi:tRNA pseudouridine13 synthase